MTEEAAEMNDRERPSTSRERENAELTEALLRLAATPGARSHVARVAAELRAENRRG